jgi:hypothetical protein
MIAITQAGQQATLPTPNYTEAISEDSRWPYDEPSLSHPGSGVAQASARRPITTKTAYS